MLESELKWREAKKSCRTFITTDINPKKRECWAKTYNWLLENAIIFKNVVYKFGR